MFHVFLVTSDSQRMRERTRKYKKCVTCFSTGTQRVTHPAQKTPKGRADTTTSTFTTQKHQRLSSEILELMTSITLGCVTLCAFEHNRRCVATRDASSVNVTIPTHNQMGVFTLVTRGWAASEFLRLVSKFNMTPNGAF